MSLSIKKRLCVFLFQYRGRSWEGCNIIRYIDSPLELFVSIPRTVVGGLQYHSSNVGKNFGLTSFNTEDGRGRAAILCP